MRYLAIWLVMLHSLDLTAQQGSLMIAMMELKKAFQLSVLVCLWHLKRQQNVVLNVVGIQQEQEKTTNMDQSMIHMLVNIGFFSKAQLRNYIFSWSLFNQFGLCNAYWFSADSSIDTTSGTGDHENFFNGNETELNVIFDNGTYSCTKAGVRIRRINHTALWPNINENKTLLFSKLTDNGRQFYTESTLDDLTSDTNENITWYSTVEPEYG